MKMFQILVSLLIFTAVTTLSVRIVLNSRSNQQNKQDLSEVNHIKYGLFSVNEWKEQLAIIISEEINKFSLTQNNEAILKSHIEVQLAGLIDNVDKRIRDANKDSFTGTLKQTFIDAVVDVNEVKKGVPQYADDILKEMTKAQTESKLKGVVKKRIDQYFKKTFAEQDMSEVNRIMERTGTPNIEAARAKLTHITAFNQRKIYLQTWLMIGLATFLFAMASLNRRPLLGAQFACLVMTLLALLFAGVSVPMIDMEAKISKMTFFLLARQISFDNQVLYFQSKSILDVFWIMITNVDWQMVLVGVLMISFSIIFPLLKMLSSLFYFLDYRHARKNRVVKFFVLKSGKWSMADVQVVAIFMAYIGFNGIIANQFGSFSSPDPDLSILTTNGTTMQPGFYIFLAYTLLALQLSGLLTKKLKSHHDLPARDAQPVRMESVAPELSSKGMI